MPIKGFFTQGVAILLSKPVKLQEVQAALRSYKITKTVESFEHWELSGPALLLPYRTDVNGHISVDIVDHPWPDSMGDPKSEPTLFGAWSMGHFGPYAFPGNLARAEEQCWSWDGGQDAASRHTGFLRIRCSYVFGADKNAPVVPADYKPLDELMFITKLARILLSLPQAICFFNPNGESLQTAEQLDRLVQRHDKSGLPPLEAWSNVRLYNLAQGEGWLLMDTVGMGQLDIPDHEACFQKGKYDPGEVASFLRNVSDYVLKKGRVIKNNDTIDGPGNIRWQGVTFEEGLSSPPREVIRWLPRDNTPRPKGIQGE